MIRNLLTAILRKLAQRIGGPIEVHVHIDGEQLAQAIEHEQYKRVVRMRAARQ